MATQYAVVQFGDVTTGEYLNIGVFAWDMDPAVTEVKSKFVSGFDRIKAAFGTSDPIFEDIVQNWLKTISSKKDFDYFAESCNSPYSSLQVTPPRGSIEPLDQLLEGVAKTFLGE